MKPITSEFDPKKLCRKSYRALVKTDQFTLSQDRLLVSHLRKKALGGSEVIFIVFFFWGGGFLVSEEWLVYLGLQAFKEVFDALDDLVSRYWWSFQAILVSFICALDDSSCTAAGFFDGLTGEAGGVSTTLVKSVDALGFFCLATGLQRTSQQGWMRNGGMEE